jgi:hypothetical protein
MRIISFVDQPEVIKKILQHLGLWEESHNLWGLFADRLLLILSDVVLDLGTVVIIVRQCVIDLCQVKMREFVYELLRS